MKSLRNIIIAVLLIAMVFSLSLPVYARDGFGGSADSGRTGFGGSVVDYYAASNSSLGVDDVASSYHIRGGDSSCNHHFLYHRGGFGGSADPSADTDSDASYYYCEYCGAIMYYAPEIAKAGYDSYVSDMPSQVAYFGDELSLAWNYAGVPGTSSYDQVLDSLDRGYITDFHHLSNYCSWRIAKPWGSHTSNDVKLYSWNTWCFFTFNTQTFEVPTGTYYIRKSYGIPNTTCYGINVYPYWISLQAYKNGSWTDVKTFNYSSTSSSSSLGTIYECSLPTTTLSVDLKSGTLYRFHTYSSQSNTLPDTTDPNAYVGVPVSMQFTNIILRPKVAQEAPPVSYDRPSQYVFNYSYPTTNNEYSYVTNTNVINETENYYYNPVTNNYYDMSNWSYDYSTRTYYLNTVDDHSVSVTYGDEYLTINEGDTVYNLYYTVDIPDHSSCVHSYVLSSSVEPTCEMPGSSFYVCSLCGSSYQSAISPLGHIWDWVETVEQEPGSNEAGDEGDEPEPPPAVVEPEPETEDPAGDQPGAGEGTIAEGPIIITQQPVDAFGEQGDSFTFTVHAIGDGLTFSWQLSTSGGRKWQNSTAASSVVFDETGFTSTLSCRPSSAFVSLYRCKIVDTSNNIVYSNPAFCRPFEPLEILHQPEAMQCDAGTRAVFSVEVSGSYPSFAWEYCGNNDDVWTPVDYSGFDTASLSVPASLDLDGTSFRCVVSNPKGDTLISDSAVLSVLPSETLDLPADDGDLQPQLFDLYRCRRCGETRLVRVGDSPVSFYSGSGLSSSWLDEFRSSLYERLDAILDETKRDYNEKLDEILGALQSGSSLLDTLFNGVTALSSLFDIPSLDDLLGVGGDILDGVTDSLPDIDFDLTDVQGAGASGSIAGILAAFAWWRTVWDIGKMFVETVSANEQAAYAYDADAPGSNPPGAPSIPLVLSAAHSFYGYDYGGQVEMFDLSWYTPYKETVDHIISGFLWLSFLWALFRHAPGIISGAGLAHSRMDDLTEGKRGRK